MSIVCTAYLHLLIEPVRGIKNVLRNVTGFVPDCTAECADGFTVLSAAAAAAAAAIRLNLERL